MKNLSVLVIDDSPIIRKRIKDILGESKSIKQLLFAGNALAVHDIEQALFGTSLGVYLQRGALADEGHENHIRAINQIRAARDKSRRLIARHRLDRNLISRRTCVSKRFHAELLSPRALTSRRAATMPGYAPQRQMLPDMRSRISASVSSTRPARRTSAVT